MGFLQGNINFVWVMSIYRTGRLDPDHIYIVQPLKMSLNFNTKIFNYFYFKDFKFQKNFTVYFRTCQYNIHLKITLIFMMGSRNRYTYIYYDSDYFFQ